jgi:hypothetical protein
MSTDPPIPEESSFVSQNGEGLLVKLLKARSWTTAVRQAELEKVLDIAIKKFSDFIHDDEAVTLFDKHIADHFSYDQEFNAGRGHPYSLRAVLDSGLLKRGINVRAEIVTEGKECCLCPEEHQADKSYKTVAYDPANVAEECHADYAFNIAYRQDTFAATSKRGRVKAALHEVAHGIVAYASLLFFGPFTWLEKNGQMDKGKLELAKKEMRRNEELFCDAITDFAMPEMPMADFRTELEYRHEVAMLQALAENDKAVRARLPHFRDNREFWLQHPDLIEELERNFYKAANIKLEDMDHPLLGTFRASSDHMLDVLQPLRTKNYINDIYDADTQTAQEIDAARFNPKGPGSSK